MKTVKLKKGQFLYFVNQDRLEEITKSSNNAKEGLVRTYYQKLRRSKEYSVKHLVDQINDGIIRLYDASKIKDGKIIEPQN